VIADYAERIGWQINAIAEYDHPTLNAAVANLRAALSEVAAVVKAGPEV